MFIKHLKQTHAPSLSGKAFYNILGGFLFDPEYHQLGIFPYGTRRGVAEQLSDGTFSFTPWPQKRSQAVPLKRVRHGLLSRTVDGGIQLTIKVRANEAVDVVATIVDEAIEATSVLKGGAL